MARGEAVALMAVDLSAAFGTADHDVLLNVLQSRFGVSHYAFQWFDSYLRPRNYKVNVGLKHSKEHHHPFSVPQGSRLGPVLYLVYASTLEQVIPEHINLHGYADNHAIKLSFDFKNHLAKRHQIN